MSFLGLKKGPAYRKWGLAAALLTVPFLVATSTAFADDTEPATVTDGNIVSTGGHVNVEGNAATVSADGQSVTYSFRVAFQWISSSNHEETVGDLAIRIPKLPGSTVEFSLIGVRNQYDNPEFVDVPMTQIAYEDATNVEVDIPSAEELLQGETPYVVTGNDSQPASTGVVDTYNLYTDSPKSKAVRVSVTVPMSVAEKIYYLPLDARMEWKANSEGGLKGLETGAQPLEDFPLHSVAYNGSLGGLADPTTITSEYVKDGHLIKSVSNPNTYITPNNLLWTWIPNDENIDSTIFFSYIDEFRLRDNSDITYTVSQSEDLADQDVSSFLRYGTIANRYMIKGTNRTLQSDYIDSDSLLVGTDYNAAENDTERPNEIVRDGITYRYVGLRSDSMPITGKIVEGLSFVWFDYEPVSDSSSSSSSTSSTSQSSTTQASSTSQSSTSQTSSSSQSTGIPASSSSSDAPATASSQAGSQQVLPNTGSKDTTMWMTTAGILVLLGIFLQYGIRKQNKE